MENYQDYLSNYLLQIDQDLKSVLASYKKRLESEANFFLRRQILNAEERLGAERAKNVANFKERMIDHEAKKKKEPELGMLWDRLEKAIRSDFEKKMNFIETIWKSYIEKCLSDMK